MLKEEKTCKTLAKTLHLLYIGAIATRNLPSLRTTSGWLGLGACFVSIRWTCGSVEIHTQEKLIIIEHLIILRTHY